MESNEYKGRKIGKYRVCCGGLCVASPDAPMLLVTASVIIGPSVVQLIFG